MTKTKGWGIAFSMVAITVCGCSDNAPKKPKTHNDCLMEHMQRIDAINVFGSSGEEGKRRQMDGSVKTMQECSEKALQDLMKH